MGGARVGKQARDKKGGKALVAGPQPGAGATTPLSFQASAAAKRKQKGEAPTTADETACEGGIGPSGKTPTKFWSLDALPPEAIGQYLLSACEPASLSARSLKDINIKGQAMLNMQRRSHLLEYITGMPSSFTLSGAYRSWSKLHTTVKENNSMRGRPRAGAYTPI